MKKNWIKWLCLGAVLLLCTGLGIFFTWEHSLPPLEGSVTVVGIEDEVTMDNYAARPTGQTASRTLTPADGDYAALRQALAELRYTCCKHTLQSRGLSWDNCYYISVGEATLYLSRDGHMLMNGKTYRADTEALYHLCQTLIQRELP